MCCFQEVRLIGQGAMMLGMKGRRYKLWWSLKGDKKLVRARKASDKVMTVVVIFKEVLRLICGYSPQSGRSLEENIPFMMS